MFKRYFYTLLARYLAVYLRREDPVIYLGAWHALLLEAMNPEHATVFRDPGELRNRTDVCKKVPEQPAAIVVNGNVPFARDLVLWFTQTRCLCTARTRLLLVCYSRGWKPLVQLACLLGARGPAPVADWLTPGGLDQLARRTGYEVVQRDRRILVPVYVPLVSAWLNRWLAPLPLFRHLTLLHLTVLRPLGDANAPAAPSVSVVVPARNEEGNIEELVRRLPRMGPRDELIFVEGHSRDDTWGALQRCQQQHAGGITIKIARQEGIGKADAVATGFALAANDFLMILDADLTVAPEELPRFYAALTQGAGEFINGSRFVYPMEKGAMSFVNWLGNRFFAAALSFVLGQLVRDTLCGTKALTRQSYDRMRERPEFFDGSDPFGDFDLLLAAARLGLKIVEVPIRYRARTYGRTNILRWRHGYLLLKLLVTGARKLRFV